jgi:hypothetical protein
LSEGNDKKRGSRLSLAAWAACGAVLVGGFSALPSTRPGDAQPTVWSIGLHAAGGALGGLLAAAVINRRSGGAKP